MVAVNLAGGDAVNSIDKEQTVYMAIMVGRGEHCGQTPKASKG